MYIHLCGLFTSAAFWTRAHSLSGKAGGRKQIRVCGGSSKNVKIKTNNGNIQPFYIISYGRVYAITGSRHNGPLVCVKSRNDILHKTMFWRKHTSKTKAWKTTKVLDNAFRQKLYITSMITLPLHRAHHIIFASFDVVFLRLFLSAVLACFMQYLYSSENATPFERS